MRSSSKIKEQVAIPRKKRNKIKLRFFLGGGTWRRGRIFLIVKWYRWLRQKKEEKRRKGTKWIDSWVGIVPFFFLFWRNNRGYSFFRDIYLGDSVKSPYRWTVKGHMRLFPLECHSLTNQRRRIEEKSSKIWSSLHPTPPTAPIICWLTVVLLYIPLFCTQFIVRPSAVEIGPHQFTTAPVLGSAAVPPPPLLPLSPPG